MTNSSKCLVGVLALKGRLRIAQGNALGSDAAMPHQFSTSRASEVDRNAENGREAATCLLPRALPWAPLNRPFRAKKLSATAGLIAVLATLASASADEPAKPKVNYQEHVLPIIQNRCAGCHNGDKQKGGLALDNYGAAMRGGSSGKVIEAGDPEQSSLWHAVNHSEQPFMPPNSPKLPDAELAVFKQWIEAGAPETSGSVVAAVKKPKFEFKLDPSSMGKPQGPPAVPEGVLTQPFVVSSRPNAVLALASSPWAPVVAVAGHKQVLLYNTTNNRLVGVLPFPEGVIHVLKFSRNGALVLAGGGRGGQSGKAVAWDVKTGKRVFEIGKEYDAVLAADISPDHGLVAVGGPNRIVRVYSTADESLVYEEKKHTEWITALEFSPDGVLLASGDRNGGLVVWEAATGREFHDLRGHSASITEVSWRLDSNVLASSSEDSTVRLWEMENGGNIKTWGAHGGGTSSVRFSKDGRLATAGRDHFSRLWDSNGGKQKDFEGFGDVAIKSVFTFDDQAIVAADYSGEVRIFELKEGKHIANLIANPAPIDARLVQAQQAYSNAKAAGEAAAKELGQLEQAASAQAQKVGSAQAAFKQAEELATKSNADAASLDQQTKGKTELEAKGVAAMTSAQAELAKAQALAGEASKVAAAKAQVAQTADANAKASKAASDQAEAARGKAAEQVAATAGSLKSALTKADVEKISAALVEQAKAVAAAAAALESANGKLAAANSELSKAQAELSAAAKGSSDAALIAKNANDLFLLAQAAVEKVGSDKTNLAKLATEMHAKALAAVAAVPARKAELDQAMAAKAGADKALAVKAPALRSIVAKAEALRADVEALTAEKKAFEATLKPTVAAAGPQSKPTQTAGN